MIRYLFIFLLLVSLSGCYTRRMWERKFPPVVTTDTIVKFTSRDSLVYRDTTLFVQLPGETLIDSITIPCPPAPPTYKPDTLKIKAKFAEVKAWLSGNKISAILTQSGTLQIRLDSVIKESYKWENLYRDILKTEVHKQRYIPIIYKVSLWAWTGVIIMVLILYLIKRIRSKI